MNLMLDNFHTPPLSTTIQKAAVHLVFHKIICRFCDLPVLTCYDCRLFHSEQFWSPDWTFPRFLSVLHKTLLLFLRLLVDGNEFVHCIFLHVKYDDCGSLSIFSCLRKNNSFHKHILLLHPCLFHRGHAIIITEILFHLRYLQMKKLGYILIAFVFIFAMLFLSFSDTASTSEPAQEISESPNVEILSIGAKWFHVYRVYLHTNTTDYDCSITLAELHEKFGSDLSYGNYVSVTAEVSTEEIYPQRIVLYSVIKLQTLPSSTND